MAKQDYMPLDDGGKAGLFLHVHQTLPTHFTALGISAATAQVSQQGADALAFDYQCRAQQMLVAAAQEATSAKNRLRDGDASAPNAAVVMAFPLAPPLVPSPVTPGVVQRFRNFAKWIKGLPGYTEAIGEALRIVGAEATPADLSTAQPVLPLKFTGARVEVGWTWGGLRDQVDTLEIWVDRGNGVFIFLTIDSRPGYVDTEPLPPSGKWRYKAIWRKNDERVGQWSDIAEITVG